MGGRKGDARVAAKRGEQDILGLERVAKHAVRLERNGSGERTGHERDIADITEAEDRDRVVELRPPLARR
jgi:hypothetical protein